MENAQNTLNYNIGIKEKIELGFLLKMSKSLKRSVIGFIFFIVGIAVFVFTFFSDSPVYFLMWGAIAFGFIDLIRGFVTYYYYKRKYKRFCINRDNNMIQDYEIFKIKGIDYDTIYINNIDEVRRKIKFWKILSQIFIIIVISGIVFLLAYTYIQTNEHGKFVGAWNVIDNDYAEDFGNTITFHSDGDFDDTGNQTFKYWKIQDGKLRISFIWRLLYSEPWEIYTDFDYTFSNENTELTLTTTEEGIKYTILLEKV